jgi:hypothetical protein
MQCPRAPIAYGNAVLSELCCTMLPSLRTIDNGNRTGGTGEYCILVLRDFSAEASLHTPESNANSHTLLVYISAPVKLS